MNKKNENEVSEVVEYMNLAKKHGLESFYLKKNDFVLEFSRKSTVQAITNIAPQVEYVQSPIVNTGVIDNPIPCEIIAENIEIINSPITGTFYQSSSPESPPFIKIGDSVSNGQILCILEAMKLMNEIKSEIDGKVVKILAKNEELIKQGDPLFHIEL
jgi:acetyl-CoA carboxylase biotin carboxyl carrier protein